MGGDKHIPNRIPRLCGGGKPNGTQLAVAVKFEFLIARYAR